MSKHPYFQLPCPDSSGSLLLTPCPGTLEASIEEALDSLKEAGATAVITLMTQPEMAKHQVERIAEQSAARGMAWFHLPVEDEGAPTEQFAQAWKKVRAQVHARLDEDDCIAVHCKGGSGRTGVVAAQILMERGASMKDAIDQVKALRPNAFSHAVQVYYITQLASDLQA